MADSKRLNGNEIWVTVFNEEAAQIFRDSVLSKAKISPQEPIVVYIDSYGGMVDSLAKMIETLDEVPNPIVTVCAGKAISCGAILLSHGDVRFCGKHSRVMIHEISGGTVGDVHDMHADALETKRLNEYFIGLLAENCKIKGGYKAFRKLIKRRDGREVYFDAEAAVKFGIVDWVGLPKIDSITTYEIMVAKPKNVALTKKIPGKTGEKRNARRK